MASFARGGLERGEGVVAALSVRTLPLLRDALGDDAARVTFMPSEEWYRRPHGTIAGWKSMLDAELAQGATYVRIIGEVNFGATKETAVTWTRYESALNAVFDGQPCWIVCPYDERVLPESIVADARRTHPSVWHQNATPLARHPSDRYVDPYTLLSEMHEPLPRAGSATLLDVEITPSLTDLRAQVREVGETNGFTRERLDDLCVVVSELATNALRYGAPARKLVVWRSEDGLVGEVTDEGAGIDDPLAGYSPPDGQTEGRMGLWLSNCLADAVAVRPTSTGAAVRFSFRLDD